MVTIVNFIKKYILGLFLKICMEIFLNSERGSVAKISQNLI
jgi:hypothetical protein